MLQQEDEEVRLENDAEQDEQLQQQQQHEWKQQKQEGKQQEKQKSITRSQKRRRRNKRARKLSALIAARYVARSKWTADEGKGKCEKRNSEKQQHSFISPYFFSQRFLAGNGNSCCCWAATCSGCYCRVLHRLSFFVFAFALAACLSTFNLFAVLCNNCNFLLSQLPTPAMLRNGRDCCSCGGCFCCRCYVIILPLRVVLHVRAASSVTYKLMQLLKFVILHLPNSPATQPHTHAHSTCGGIVRSGSPDGASKLSGTQRSNYGHWMRIHFYLNMATISFSIQDE